MLFYANTQVFFNSQFSISTIVLNTITAHVPKFKSDFFLNLIVNANYQVCPGLGYEIEEVAAVLSTSLKFNDCYKVVLTDLCDFSSSWSGYNAKWIDECDLSNDSLIEIFDYTLIDTYQDFPSLGTVTATSKSYCYNLPLLSNIPNQQDPFTDLAKIMYSRVFSYIDSKLALKK